MQERDRALDHRLQRQRDAPRRSLSLPSRPSGPGAAAEASEVAPADESKRSPLPGPWPAGARGVRAWSVLLVLLALWSTAETPYRLAFGSAPDEQPVRRRLEASALAVDLLFCLDCLLRTCVLLPVHGLRGEGTHADVAKAWLSSWKVRGRLHALACADALR